MSQSKTATLEQKYKHAKRVVHNLEKALAEKDVQLAEKDKHLEYYVRSLSALRGAMERVQGGQTQLTKEEIMNQMQTELPSSDDDEDPDDAEPTERELEEAREKAGVFNNR